MHWRGMFGVRRGGELWQLVMRGKEDGVFGRDILFNAWGMNTFWGSGDGGERQWKEKALLYVG